MATFPTLPCCRRSRAKGTETLVIETLSGQQITLQTSPGSILIQDGNGNSLRMDPSGITINTSAKLTINASLIELSAGELAVNAGMANFSGVLQANAVIATTVIRGGSIL
jgi:hypothetical protein